MTSPSMTPAASSTAPGPTASVSFWEQVAFGTMHGVASVLLTCLSLRGLYRLGRVFGTFEWAVNYKRRRRFAAALQRALGREPTASERRRATREFFMQSRWDKLFYLVFDRISRDKAEALFTITNPSLLEDAFARGHGVYMAMAHHGPHHVVAMLLALRGYKVAGVRDRREGGLRRYVQNRCDRLRSESSPMHVLFADSYPRDVYRCFQQGFVLGSAMDVSRIRNPNQKAEEVTIFGEKRLFLSGPLRVALRCRAPVLQAFIVPDNGCGYRLDIVTMLVDPERVEDESAAVAEAIRIYAVNVEKYIRATPTLLTRV